MLNLWQDLRYAVRMLAKSPGFTTVAVLTLALGIGANTAIFSLLNAVVLKALPVQRPNELVRFAIASSNGGENSSMSYPYFERIRDRNQTLSSVFAFSPLGRVNVGFEGKASLAKGQVATGSFFPTLGLTPFAGRFFTNDDDNSRRPLAVLSYVFWQREFNGDVSVIGKTISLNRIPFTVIGVMPASFLGVEVGDSPDVTVPLTLTSQLISLPSEVWSGLFDTWLEIMGRLKPGVTRQEAQAEFDVINHQLLTDFVRTAAPDERRFATKQLGSARLNVEPGATGFESGLRYGFSKPLQILLTIVGIVLLIACANVANLLLSRAAARRKEIAVRLAIGASRARLIRQLLTESMLLAGFGGTVGFLVAKLGGHLLVNMVSTNDSPVALDGTMDLRILMFTAGVSILTSILFGVLPALRATRIDLTPALKEGGILMGSEVHHRRFGMDKALVTGQVALSLALLIGAGLFVRSLQKLWAVDPGYDRTNVLMFSLNPRLAGYGETSKISNLDRQLLENLRAMPGVRSASVSLVRPVDEAAYWVNVVGAVDGRKLGEDQGVHVALNSLGPGYFANLGQPLLLGREFDAADSEKSPKVAIISETLARQCFGKENPIGHRITAHGDGEFQIIGVAKDSRYGNVRDKPRSVLYMAFFQGDIVGAYFDTTFEARYSGSSSAVLEEVRRQIRALDPNLPLFRVKTLEVQTQESFVKERLLTTFASFFGLLAMLLACVGLYGTITYRVGRRTREIGVRLALGADRGDILLMVLKEVVSMVAIGIVIGIPFAVVASRVIASLLFTVKTTDPATISIAALVMFTTAAVAGYIPARRAAKVDPMVALRYE